MSFFSKKYNNFRTPDLSIYLNGKEINSKEMNISDVEVDLIRNGSGSFRFVVSEAIGNDFTPKFEQELNFGNFVEIALGYQNKKEPVIKGFISSVRYIFKEKNFLDIEVEGYDYLFLLSKNRPIRSWNRQKISEIVEFITQSYPIKNKEIQDSSIKFDYIRQSGKSDLQFLRYLSQKAGYEFLIIDDTFYFREPLFDKSADFSLEFGVDIMDIEISLDISSVFNKLTVSGWDFKSKKGFKSEINSGDEPLINPDGVSGTQVVSKNLKTELSVQLESQAIVYEEAETVGKSVFYSRSLDFADLTCRAVGIPDIKPSSVLSIQKIGNRFSKNYFVERVVHRFSDTGFNTLIKLKGNVV